MNAQQLLEQLSNAYAKLDLIQLDKKESLPADVRKAIEDNEIAFQERIEEATAAISELEAQVKSAVMAEGLSTKAGGLQAVYMKGRVSWDGKKLEGLMMVIPQVAQARKEGAPSVSIRRVGDE